MFTPDGLDSMIDAIAVRQGAIAPSAGTFCPTDPSKDEDKGSYSEYEYDDKRDPPQPAMDWADKLVTELLLCAQEGDEKCLQELIVFMSKNATQAAIWDFFPPEKWTGEKSTGACAESVSVTF